MIRDQEGKEEEMTSHYKISDYYCIQSICGIKSSCSKCILLMSFEHEIFMQGSTDYRLTFYGILNLCILNNFCDTFLCLPMCTQKQRNGNCFFY